MRHRGFPAIIWLFWILLLAGSLLFASVGGVYAFTQDTDLSGADASFWGEDALDYSGHSVASAGDVNGDGYDDFLIGAPHDDDGGSDAGQSYLIGTPIVPPPAEESPGAPIWPWILVAIGVGLIVIGLVSYVLWRKRATVH